MTETQMLCLALAVVYAVENLRWLRTGAIGVRTWLGRGWRAVDPSMLFGNHLGGLVFLHPFPPLGTLLMAAPLPVKVSTEGIWTTETLLPWKDAGRIEVASRRLVFEGRAIADAGSNTLASTLRAALCSLAAVPEGARAAAVQEWRQRRMNPAEVRRSWEEFHGEIRTLRWLCNALFLVLFVVFPWVTHHHGIRDTWWMLILGVLACMAPIAIVCRRLHQRLYPAADEDRLTLFLINLLSPASAVRAVDRLSLPLLAGFHPLTLVRVFCPETEFRRMAAVGLRQLRFPRPGDSGAWTDAERSHELAELEEFLRREGLNPEELLHAPKAEPGCEAYCPRCLAQFKDATGACADCGAALLPNVGRAELHHENAD